MDTSRTAIQPRRIRSPFLAACILAANFLVFGAPASAQQDGAGVIGRNAAIVDGYLDGQDDSPIATLSTGDADWDLMPASPQIDAEAARYTAIFEALQEANDGASRRPDGAWKAPSGARGAELLVLLTQCRHQEHTTVSKIARSLDPTEWTADHQRLWERRSTLKRIASLIDSQMDRRTQEALIETYGAIPHSTLLLAQEEEELRAAFGDEYFEPGTSIGGHAPERSYDASRAREIAEVNFSQKCLLLAAGIR